MKHIVGQAVVSTILLANPQLAQGNEYIVQIFLSQQGEACYFRPKKLYINYGDTVTWVNMQDTDNSIGAKKIPISTDSFESPILEKNGDTWSHTFTASGTYTYNCHKHPSEKSGVIIVDNPSTPFEIKDIDGTSNKLE